MARSTTRRLFAWGVTCEDAAVGSAPWPRALARAGVRIHLREAERDDSHPKPCRRELAHGPASLLRWAGGGLYAPLPRG